jgi:hypothetical protein
LMKLSVDLSDGKADINSIQSSVSPDTIKALMEAYMPKN